MRDRCNIRELKQLLIGTHIKCFGYYLFRIKVISLIHLFFYKRVSRYISVERTMTEEDVFILYCTY